MMMSALALRFILLLVSIAMCTGIRQAQYNNYEENSELPINSVDPSMEVPELIGENQHRELNKLLEKNSGNNLEMDEINENEQINFETEMAKEEKNDLIKESKHPKQLSAMETIAAEDHIPDENDNQKLLSMLNLDVLEGTLELKGSDNDQENMPNLQVVLNSSVSVGGALRNIFEKLLRNPQTLLDSPVADLEKPDISSSVEFSKTSNTLEATAELQASHAVQKALAEFHASNIIQQAIAELRSSNAMQNALEELQKSPVIQKVITELKSSNAAKERLTEGLSSIHMIMTEASKCVQKAMAEDPKAFQKALAGLQNSNAIQDAIKDLGAFSGAQETIDKIQTENEFKEAMEELMALNDMENAIIDAQDSIDAEEPNDLK